MYLAARKKQSFHKPAAFNTCYGNLAKLPKFGILARNVCICHDRVRLPLYIEVCELRGDLTFLLGRYPGRRNSSPNFVSVFSTTKSLWNHHFCCAFWWQILGPSACGASDCFLCQSTLALKPKYCLKLHPMSLLQKDAGNPQSVLVSAKYWLPFLHSKTYRI